jgi:hypothetical protein
MSRNTDWAKIRAEFPAVNRWTCLNTAAYGQLPTRGTKAVADYWDRCNELACADFRGFVAYRDRLLAVSRRFRVGQEVASAQCTGRSAAWSDAGFTAFL